VGTQTSLPIIASLPGGLSKPLVFETSAVIGAAREGLLHGVALGVLARRGERLGRAPTVFEVIAAALATSFAAAFAGLVPMPWGPPSPLASLASRSTFEIMVAVFSGVVGAGIVAIPRALGYAWALRGQAHWSQGVRLEGPTQLLGFVLFGFSWLMVKLADMKSSGPIDLAQAASLNFLRSILVVAIAGVALPLLVRWVPVAMVALGIHTRDEPTEA
jgi:hypothetical protein